MRAVPQMILQFRSHSVKQNYLKSLLNDRVYLFCKSDGLYVCLYTIHLMRQKNRINRIEWGFPQQNI